MKQRILLPLLILLVAACGKDDKNCPDNSVTAIRPNSNPAGYEVLIETNGFTDDAVVRFGQSVAASRAGGEGGHIIARVPAGLAGNVQVTLEEGDCLERFDDFQVLGSYPSDIQLALTTIVVPPPGIPPVNAFQNVWVNAADASAGFNLQPDQNGVDPQLIDPDLSTEFFENFSITNPITGTVDLAANKVFIRVDRTARGGDIESFDGAFIFAPTDVPGLPVRPYYLLLTSRTTGRQVLLLPPG